MLFRVAVVGLEAVGADVLHDLGLVNAEALADERALLVGLLPALAAVVGNGGVERLPAHDGAVHLLRGQPVKIVSDVLVGDLEGLVDGLALDHLGKG